LDWKASIIQAEDESSPNPDNLEECTLLIFPTRNNASMIEQPIVLELLDAWRERQPGIPSRAEAIEALIAIGLAPETRKWI
jgi:hypothetical protein